MRRPFRFGVQVSSASSREEWAGLARRAEALGYDVFCVPDHVGTQLSPFAALTAAAAATSTIRVGTMVLDNDFRHPLLMAHEAATVHLLSGGRLELGLGAGWLGRDYRRLGVPFDAPGTRVERLGEALEIVDLYFGGEPFSFAGRHYEVSEVEPLKLPPGMERPALLVGGGGPRVLSLAARHADAASVFLRSRRDGSGFGTEELRPEAYRQKVDHVRTAANGRSVEINLLLQSFEITDDRARAVETHARDFETSPEIYLALPFGLVGSVNAIVEDVLRRREEYGISYVTVRDLEAFAPVVERLSGT